MTILTCGIDPGKSGGVSLLKDGEILDIRPMPITAGRVCPVEIASMYREYKRIADELGVSKVDVFIERVQAMPHDGKVGLCSYWQGAGRLEMAAIYGWGIHLIPWGTWASTFHTGLPQDMTTKQKSEIAFKQYYPLEVNRIFASPRCRKPHDGMIESALIGLYGFRRIRGQ